MTVNRKDTAVKIAHVKRFDASSALARLLSIVAAHGIEVQAPNASAVDQAQLELEDCLAARRLGEATAEDEQRARASLVAAQNTYDEAIAAFSAQNLEHAGMSRRLAHAEYLEVDTKAALTAAEADWIREEMQQIERLYMTQAQALYTSYMRLVACVAALNGRGIKDTGYLSYSSDLEIPTIGPLSCQAFKATRPSEPHGVGKLLFSAEWRDMYGLKDDGVERDLAALNSGKGSSGVVRFAKVVSGLIPQQEK